MEEAGSMKWFFYLDARSVIQLNAPATVGGLLGDAHSEVKVGDNFCGVSYAVMRDAKGGIIEVDAKGHGELKE
jgi:hypothetical protein